jgi:hypothetical protein
VLSSDNLGFTVLEGFVNVRDGKTAEQAFARFCQRKRLDPAQCWFEPLEDRRVP